MKKLLFIALLAISSIVSAQEYKINEAWCLAASSGVASTADVAKTNVYVEAAKWITPAVAIVVSIDGIIKPPHTGDKSYDFNVFPSIRVNLTRPIEKYKKPPVKVLADIGFGIGHVSGNKTQDHNFNTYNCAVHAECSITNELMFRVSLMKAYRTSLGYSRPRSGYGSTCINVGFVYALF